MNDTTKSSSKSLKVILLLLGLGIIGCLGYFKFPGTGKLTPKETQKLFNEGIHHLDQYQYGKAHDIFTELSKAHPEVNEFRFNKGIAALNLQNEFVPIAEDDFKAVLKLDPNHIHANFCLGILYETTSRIEMALGQFIKTAELAPEDPFVLFKAGSLSEQLEKLDDAFKYFEKAYSVQPALASAIYRLSFVHRIKGNSKEGSKFFKLFNDLKNGQAQILVGKRYGEAGPHYQAIREFKLKVKGSETQTQNALTEEKKPQKLVKISTIIDQAAQVKPLLDGEVGRLPLAVGEVTGDGKEDFIVGGQVKDGKVGVEIWKATEGNTFNLHHRFEIAALAIGVGDLDEDVDQDLVLVTEKEILVLTNDGKGSFSQDFGKIVIPEDNPLTGQAIAVRLLDTDSDWDLDIVVLYQVERDERVQGSLRLLNNNRDGSFEDISRTSKMDALSFAPTDFVFADIDRDRDQDFLILESKTGKVWGLRNDRIGRFQPFEVHPGNAKTEGARQISLESIEGTGDIYLEFHSTGKEPQGFKLNPGDSISLTPHIAKPKTYSSVAPFQLGYESAVLIPSFEGQPRWVVGGPDRTVDLLGRELNGTWIAFELNGPNPPTFHPSDGLWANQTGIGGLAEVVIDDSHQFYQVNGEGGGSSRTSHRIYIELPKGIEAIDYIRILWPDGLLQSENQLNPYVKVLKPDGTVPTDEEAEKVKGEPLKPGKTYVIKEHQRKPVSCPLLFAWTGEKFDYIGDFLGVGGLGYFLGPHNYNQPDPTEMFAIPGLKPRKNDEGKEVLDLRIVEPLEECTYLDGVKLVSVDHPKDVQVVPNEMFAVNAPKPGFELLAFKKSIQPLTAVDHNLKDISKELSAVDRSYAENWKKDPRFHGMSTETHELILDFGNSVEEALKANKRPFLLLYGYIEYSYSTSNFAASQAKVQSIVPTFSVERGGKWEVLRDQWGFPAGTPRWMALSLEDIVKPGDRKFKVSTNLEIYWDQVILAHVEPSLESVGCKLQKLEVDSAVLRQLGFPKDSFPNNTHPRVYDYQDVIPFEEIFGKQMSPFPGKFTRFGDVKDLLTEADDRFVIFGPGDEIQISMDASSLTPLSKDQRRTYFIEASGWCKDTDLYTGYPGRVDPLPFKEMKSYPMEGGAEASIKAFEEDPIRKETAEKYHTREVLPLWSK